MEQFRRIDLLIEFQGKRQNDESWENFLLTPYHFNGKKMFTVDELRQRRFNHRIERIRTTKSSTRENWLRTFFLPFKALPRTFAK